MRKYDETAHEEENTRKGSSKLDKNGRMDLQHRAMLITRGPQWEQARRGVGECKSQSYVDTSATHNGWTRMGQERENREELEQKPQITNQIL
jgi:hypothetical protein